MLNVLCMYSLLCVYSGMPLFLFGTFMYVVFSFFCKFYVSLMHIIGINYYVFQRVMFKIIERVNYDFVSCSIFPLFLVDTLFKFDFKYSRFEEVYFFNNIGFFMCL